VWIMRYVQVRIHSIGTGNRECTQSVLTFYVASAVIYFECGWRIVLQGTYVLWKVKSSSEVKVVLWGFVKIIILWWKLWNSEGAMDQGAIDIRSRSGKMKVTLLINYYIHNIIILLYNTHDGSGKERWKVQVTDHGAMDWHALQEHAR